VRRRRIGAAVLLAVVAGTGTALAARQGGDPEAALREIGQWYSEQIRKAREEQRQPDLRVLNEQRAEKVRAALAGIDPAKVEPAKQLALAQLYQTVRMSKEMTAAAERFLATNPEAERRLQAQLLLLSGYAALEDAAGIRRVLAQTRPSTPIAAAAIARMAGGMLAEIVARKDGVEAGLSLLDTAAKLIPSGAPSSDQERLQVESARAALALGRADILEGAERGQEALKVLEDARARIAQGSPAARSLDSRLRQLRLVGQPAPELKADRVHGTFTSLAALRGKVVVLDFTAHW